MMHHVVIPAFYGALGALVAWSVILLPADTIAGVGIVCGVVHGSIALGRWIVG